MILPIQRQVHSAITDAIHRAFGLSEVPPFTVETPPNRALGDLAVTVAFQLARTLRKAPRAIAQELATALEPVPGIATVVGSPDRLPEPLLRAEAVRDRAGDGTRHAPRPPDEGKMVVEHTAINPNKAAHIGHLRNATLGDTLVRVLRFRGTPVEMQNYIDDTGVQVADVIVGFQELEQKTLDDVQHIAETTRFDYYCWDLYSRSPSGTTATRQNAEVRAQALHDLEHGGNEVAAMGTVIVDRIVRAHLKTMARLNIGYDLLTYEGDILRLKFWAHCLRDAEGAGRRVPADRGQARRLLGDAHRGGRDAEPSTDGDEKDEEAREKVIVRSNGVVTYVGKDIANQFWKFGLLGRDFHYRRFAVQHGDRPALGDDHAPTARSAVRRRSAARRASTTSSTRGRCICRRCSARRCGRSAIRSEAENSIHFSYEMVALSHATARELGYPAEPEATTQEAVRRGVGPQGPRRQDRRPARRADRQGEGRSGARATRSSRRTNASGVAEQIAVGAIRYFMLKFSRGKLIVFDMEEALSFEGETGPYLQYAVVRAEQHLRQAAAARRRQ